MIPKFREWDAEREDIMPGKGMSYGKREDSDDAFLIRFDHMEDLDIINKNGSIDRTVMMSTGLKDKNGVDIYIGDILEWEMVMGHGWYENGKDEVTYDEKELKIKMKNRTDYTLNRVVGVGCEVIGNIYEHPHLLME